MAVQVGDQVFDPNIRQHIGHAPGKAVDIIGHTDREGQVILPGKIDGILNAVPQVAFIQ